MSEESAAMVSTLEFALNDAVKPAMLRAHMHQPSWAGVGSVELSLLIEQAQAMETQSQTGIVYLKPMSQAQCSSAMQGMPMRQIASLQAAGTAKLC